MYLGYKNGHQFEMHNGDRGENYMHLRQDNSKNEPFFHLTDKRNLEPPVDYTEQVGGLIRNCQH